MSKLSQEQIDEMAALREDGWPVTRLAEKFGVAHNTVSRHCYTVGAIPPSGLPSRNVAKRGYKPARGRTVSDRERDAIWRMRLENMSVPAIAKKLKRQPSTIYHWVTRLAIEQDSHEVAA